MKKIFFFIVMISSLNTFAQKLPFPKDYNTKDSLVLSTNMQELAEQLTSAYKDENLVKYLDNVFRYQIVAEQYTGSLNNLDSMRNIVAAAVPKLGKAIGFQYETFARAKILQSKNNIPFKEAFIQSFKEQFITLSEEAKAMAASYFGDDPEPMKEKFYNQLNSLRGKDSIALKDAQLLIKNYNSWIVYSQVNPIGLLLLAEEEDKKFIIEDSVLIKSRDGALLSATIVRKKTIIGKQPAVLMFNIYTGEADMLSAKSSAINGYVGIVVNTRGKNLSPQEIDPFEHDANDAYDVIDWISKQSWSNGKVGMYGGSYLGFSQWAAAKKVHPALKTIVPQTAAAIGVDFPMQNNVFTNYMLRWIHLVTNSKQTDLTDFNSEKWGNAYSEYYKSGRAFNALDTIEGRPNNIFQRWLKHPSHDSYWQNMVAYKKDFAQINIPVLTTTGYFDQEQLGAMYYYNEHLKYNKNANHYLLIGPYDHAGAQGNPAPVLNGYTLDSVAVINIKELAFKWFDFILKDSSKPAILKDKVNYQVMGTNTWKHAPTLSKMNNDTLNFYFSNVLSGSGYKLSTTAQSSKFVPQKVDFKDRTDTTHRSEKEVLIDSVLDASNGLTFVSQTFDKPFEINGAFTGMLMASINKKDLDVTISLYELRADGTYFNLSNFLGRASYAKDRSKRELLIPGKIETIPYTNSFIVSAKINAGSKLVVVLGVNKNKYWQINYGSGKDVSEEIIKDAKEPLEIKWYGNSSIKIPVYRY
jgi:hypothetical protein